MLEKSFHQAVKIKFSLHTEDDLSDSIISEENKLKREENNKLIDELLDTFEGTIDTHNE